MVFNVVVEDWRLLWLTEFVLLLWKTGNELSPPVFDTYTFLPTPNAGGMCSGT